MPAPDALWVGVDVGGERKGLHVAVVDRGRLVRPVERSLTVEAAVALLRELAPALVAVDSPQECAAAGESSRACERDLRRAVCGIRYTPDCATVYGERADGDDFYGWIKHGFALYAALAEAGLEAVECFPTASWTRWAGAREPSRGRGAWSSEALAGLGLGDVPARLNQDERDAIGAALTARAHAHGETERFGLIVVPLGAAVASGSGRRRAGVGAQTASSSSFEPGTFVLRGATVLGPSGHFDGPLDVVVEAGVISDVRRHARPAAPGCPELDAAGLFVMPGVVDAHAHVAISTLDTLELLRKPVTRWALEAGVNLRATLEGGVTFLRDAGGADAGIHDAVEAGVVPGPRLQVSVVGICRTGGHFDGLLAGPGLEISGGYVFPDYPGRPPFRADGPEDMRRVVRHILRAGADVIKVCATGGLLAPHEGPDEAQLDREELAAAVVEARRAGRPVMCHAYGGDGLLDAVEAGVASIEHGTLLDEEQAAAMARRGTWLVPTLAICEEMIAWARAGLLPPASAAKALAVEPLLGDAVQLARAAGVRLAVGTDSAVRSQHGGNLVELALLAGAGLPPHEVLLAATAGGAELCGVGSRVGRIAPGLLFDAIVLDADPGDLSCFRRRGTVTGVFKGGLPAVPHAQLSPARPTAEGAGSAVR